ncbi:autotransporter outer membrane beta-barrel domain-containing protein [Acidisoma cladoniae]|jgi:hypothetical protein|uniref:autotransporter outer membrane beta-barrel domain-containing protein n=1 Tax=Acidisoma cladoniae TaxID=3040935 RepID=UPI00254F2187|nr:autotransporter outer membrane beta-barrel domain-containing protein [Acidisoma sp. PAMC 29798]
MSRKLLACVVFWAVPAWADAGTCSNQGNVRVCVGDFSNTGGVALDFTSIGNNGSSGSFGFIPSSGAAGDNSGSPSEAFSGSASSGSIAVRLLSRGGMGGNGGNGLGGGGAEGGRGGETGTVSLTLTGARITASGNQAIGTLAQSTGGAGGNGGSGSVGAGGGIGGLGAAGRAVSVSTNNAAVNVSGTNAVGLAAISDGGNGGKGGAGNLSTGGGHGGDGGNGGNVAVSLINDTQIRVNGVGALGILAQSNGGLGGAGGNGNVGGGGGGGGTGGSGGNVAVDLASTVITTENQSIGLLAQSIGGFGGNGGNASGIAVTGGVGQSSGNGGPINVNFHGIVSTTGDGSVGIEAQSIGGGGGAGGSSSGIATVGGSGAGGGNASTISLGFGNINSYDITQIFTRGAYAPALLAQSVGGGGGSGGGGAGIVNVGGNAGGGGNGGNIAFQTRGPGSLFNTTGAESDGLQLQSIGGGGGTGGSSVSVGPVFSLAVGGSGGGGGNGGNIFVNNSGALIPIDVATKGNGSTGVSLESTGGGGGAGGWAASAAVGNIAVSTAVGGSGGNGGNAGSILMTGAGDISTAGDDAAGLLAQSAGGGGGQSGLTLSLALSTNASAAVAVGGSGGGGGNGGNAAVGWVANSSNIATEGNFSPGMEVESEGGGGGDAGLTIAGAGSIGGALALGIGGSGGNGGTSGTAIANAQGTVTTKGDDSAGILAESIAGGGGNGGVSIVAALGGQAALSAAVGGSGGGGQAAGSASASFDGALSTAGRDSPGVSAASVGGGGGAGGFAGTVSLGRGAATLGVAVGGSGGSGGTGGSAVATSSGTIKTLGASSAGISATSIGGGGGTGGFALGLSGGGTLSGNAAIGGSGAGGAAGGGASVNATGAITSEGALSDAIDAISVGGGGGSGGFALSGNLAMGQGGFGVAVGGSGAQGGNGGQSTVTNAATIKTSGAVANGILASSIGGGGGSGGFAIAGNIIAGSSPKGITIGIGGGGGTGGDAGVVTVRNTGAVTVAGPESSGILATSEGGGGGNAGFSGTVSLGASSSLTTSVTVGRSGGSGGNGNAVTVFNSGAITLPKSTASTPAGGGFGLLALSVGGGGGDGGSAGSLQISGKSSWSANVTVGGAGGGGGTGAPVQVSQSGAIQTFGEEASDIVAQSVGGGGGDGGLAFAQSYSGGYLAANLTVAVGGKGGKGGDASTVFVTNAGALSTAGNSANGILAESVGGGGGNGGLASSTSGLVSTQSGGSASFAVGGSGGVAGQGSTVTVANYAPIVTGGGSADGILAQSVGGGGGNGGDARGVAQILALLAPGNPEAGKTFAVSVSIGGEGGASGNGGLVSVSNDAAITVSGANSRGIDAQSVGGGGGNGGDLSANGSELLSFLSFANFVTGKGSVYPVSINVGGSGGSSGSGGSVGVRNTASITASGTEDIAIEAQSVGGGGGDGGFGLPGRVNVGGQGGSSGNGGAVTVDNSGTLVTTGDSAIGIMAESIGGGGGNGGDTSSPISAPTSAVGFSIGGFGGSSGSGGSVGVVNTGDITTNRGYAPAIFAQSVGGGGGTGGNGVAVLSPKITLPGLGSNGGNGGSVTVSNSAAIATAGTASYGIMAESVGGGGGVAGAYSVGLEEKDVPLVTIPDLSFTFGSVGTSAGGSGGNVSVNNSGTITVTGSGTVGILAQSVGGSGGLFGLSDGAGFLGSLGFGSGTGGNVTLTQSGVVQALGTYDVGVLLQSMGPGGNGNIDATINGQILTDAPTSTAMVVSGGNNNTITIGTTGVISGQKALFTGSGNDTIDNSGTITGLINLGAGTNRLNNQAGGVLNTAATVDLGAGTLINGGTILPGGGTALQTTTISGTLDNTSTGTLRISLGDAGAVPGPVQSSQIIVNGQTALSGKLVVAAIPGGALLVPGTDTITLLTAANPLVDKSTGSSADAIITFLNKQTIGNSVQAQVQVNYAVHGVRSNAAADSVANAITAIAEEETSVLPIDAALVDMEQASTEAALEADYESFSPQAYAASRVAMTYAALGYNDLLFDGGAGARFRTQSDDGHVFWLDTSGGLYHSTAAATNFSQSGAGPSLGGVATLADGWKVGFGAGLHYLTNSLNGYASGQGWLGDAGVTAGHSLGPIDAAVALSASAEGLQMNRSVAEGAGATATGSQTIAFATATGRLSHGFPVAGWEIRPLVEASVIGMDSPSFTESGAGALNLSVDGTTTAALRGTAAVALSGMVPIFGIPVQSSLQIGASGWLAGGGATVTAAFQDVPAETPSVIGYAPDNGVMGDVGLKLSVATRGGVDLRLSYAGQFNAQTRIQDFGLEAATKF